MDIHPTQAAGHHTQTKLLVLVTSIEGHIQHPFDADARVGDVRQFAYDHLVRQKEQIPLNRTWMELDGARLEDGTVLGSVTPNRLGGPAPDLTLSLVWETGGGCTPCGS